MAVQHQAFQVHVTGRVQGVGFRDWTAREARRLGLAGWVRTVPDVPASPSDGDAATGSDPGTFQTF